MTLSTDYQNFIHLSRYGKWIETDQRRETWEETIQRYLTFFDEHIVTNYPDAMDEFQKIKTTLFENIFNLQIMPSMRCMMTAGKALERDNAAAFNCWYLPINSPKCFDEAMYLSMCGGGVGFSVEQQYTKELPIIPEELLESETTIIVADSKTGWSQAYREFISLLYQGIIPKWDISKIRPAGTKLKTMGGRASGPQSLINLFLFTTDVFKKAVGRKLSSLECHDIMCKIAEIVVVGGVRRSALISLSDLTDERMRDAKSGEWWKDNRQRALSNNSACYIEKPEIGLFIKELLALYQSKSGERGIFNRESAKKLVAKIGRRDPDWEFGCNPCQPDYATLLTPTGIQLLKNIHVGDTIWTGSNWTTVIDKQNNGKKEVYKYSTTTGNFIGTTNHNIIQNGKKCIVEKATSIDWCTGPTIQATIIDQQNVMDGLLIGDGSVHKASNNLIYLNIGKNDHDYFTDPINSYITKIRPGLSPIAYEIKTTLNYKELPKTFLRFIPNSFFFGDENKKVSFLRGLFSANGSICGNRITLKQTSKILIQQVQEMLSSIGIHSFITKNQSRSNKFSNGTYQMKESYDLNITSGRSIFKDKIGFIQTYKQNKIIDGGIIKHKTSNIKTIEYLETTDVYSITVADEKHTYWTGGCLVANCNEILLRPKQACNLSEVVVRPTDSIAKLKHKIELATILGTLQSTLTNFRYLSKEWKRNCEEERLLGVSLTGIMDHPHLSGGKNNQDLPRTLTALKNTTVETNQKWADILGINHATAITCIKPSGNVSQLVNSASGIHPRYAPFYIRRVRQDLKSPITEFMINKDYPYETDHTNTENTVIFSFPTKAPENAIMRNDRTALQQLEHWLLYQKYWCEHKPSITVYVKEHEWLDIGAWVYKNFDYVSGIAFLPYSDHIYTQAPYEEITKEVYETLLTQMPKNINWKELAEFEKEDTTTGSMELACGGDKCEL